MNTTTIVAPCEPCAVEAVCVNVDDLGVVDTEFGPKPQVKFTFETKNEAGEPRRLCRTFNKYFHEKSALCMAVRNWTGRYLESENKNMGEPDLAGFVDCKALLKLQHQISRKGTAYDKIVEILPREDDVQEERLN